MAETRSLLGDDDIRFGGLLGVEDKEFWCRFEGPGTQIATRSVIGGTFWGGTHQTFDPQKLNRLTVWTATNTPIAGGLVIHVGIYQRPGGRVGAPGLPGPILKGQGTLTSPIANTAHTITLDQTVTLERGIYWICYGGIGTGTHYLNATTYGTNAAISNVANGFHPMGFQFVNTALTALPATFNPFQGSGDVSGNTGNTALWARGALV